jgi:hypothetical protein
MVFNFFAIARYSLVAACFCGSRPLMFEQHFNECSHLIGDSERITALADTICRECVASLVGIAISQFGLL